MVGGEEGEGVGHCVPGSIIWEAKALRQKGAWLVEGRLCVRRTHNAAGEVGWGQILQGLAGHGKEFGVCFLYRRMALLRAVILINTNN